MAMTKYSYTISTAFPGAKVESSRLTTEIGASTIVTALDHIDTAEGICDIWFKAPLSGGDETLLAGLLAVHSGEALTDVRVTRMQLYTGDSAVPTSDGMPLFAMSKPVGLEGVNFFSHNWCDKCTWAEKATLVTDETATDSGDHTTYTLAHQFVIDLRHGRVTQEDFYSDPTGQTNTHWVVVKVNGTAKVEKDAHTGTGDFTVNYEEGKIVFASALNANDVVTVSYHYAGSSEITIVPFPGTKLVINLAEIQFSADFVMNDTVVYAVYGPIDIWAPQYLQANGGPYPAGTKIPLKRFVYKRVQDFLNDAMRAYPTYPAMGGDSSNWRAMSQPVIVFDWDYLRSKAIDSALGLEIRCKLQHDTPFGGKYATVTFYCDTAS